MTWMMALLEITTSGWRCNLTVWWQSFVRLVISMIQRMLAYIKTQTEIPKFPESGFALDKIMHLYINVHRLALTRGGSYIELPKWLKSKKAVINPQNKDEKCFKWAVIAALHHEEIKKHHQRISKLRP